MERSLVQPELWSNPDEGVNVTRAGVRIGSSTLELPTTEARLIEILGQPDRRSTLQNTILVWDHLGMFAYETPGTESIDSIAVSFTCRDVDYCPKNTYPGVLVVDDAVFWKEPQLRDIVRYGFRADEFFCYRSVGKYQVSVGCTEGSLGLGTFEIALK